MSVQLDLLFELFHHSHGWNYFGKMAFEIFLALSFIMEAEQFVLLFKRETSVVRNIKRFQLFRPPEFLGYF